MTNLYALLEIDRAAWFVSDAFVLQMYSTNNETSTR